MTAEKLLEELLKQNSLISYKEARIQLVGPYSGKFSQHYADEAVRLAEKSPERRVGDLSIRLDALVVSLRTGEPSEGHFSGKSYTRAQWRKTFGEWQRPKQIR